MRVTFKEFKDWNSKQKHSPDDFAECIQSRVDGQHIYFGIVALKPKQRCGAFILVHSLHEDQMAWTPGKVRNVKWDSVGTYLAATGVSHSIIETKSQARLVLKAMQWAEMVD